MSALKITGIDLAKINFYLFIINEHGNPAEKINLMRTRLLNWLAQKAQKAQKAQMIVAMEACGASHHWAREIQSLGHRPSGCFASGSACQSLPATSEK